MADYTIEIRDGEPFRLGVDFVLGERFEYRLNEDGSVTYRQPAEEKP